MSKIDYTVPSFDNPWSLGEEQYLIVKELLGKEDNKNILECGSGVSTVRFGLDFQNSNIYSLEQSEKYKKETLEQLAEYGIDSARIFHCPLKLQRNRVRFYYTYDTSTEQLPANVDLALIDGPVESVTLRGREGILYNLFPRINTNGYIVLDDYHRKSSKKSVVNWLNSYPGQLELYKEYPRIAILKKIADNGMHFPGIYSLFDNWKSLVLLSLKRIKRKFI